MRASPRKNPGHRLVQSGLLILALLLTIFGIAGLASQAKAAPVTMEFDNGRLSLGGLLRDQKVLPATGSFPSDSLPVPQLTTTVKFTGDATDGVLNMPAAVNNTLAATNFPYMNVEHPAEPGLLVPFTIRLKEPGLTGTYDEATGAATLNGAVDVIVVTGQGASFPLPDMLDAGVPPLGLLARCVIPDLPVNFSTETTSPITAQRFTDGLGKNGAMTATWYDPANTVPENNPEEDTACGTLNSIIHGNGALWLSNGIETPQPQPPPTPDPEPTCETDPSLCPPEPRALISRIAIAPKARQIRAGGKARLRIRVTNRGDLEARSVAVNLRSSNKRVKVPRRVTLRVPAGSTATRWVRVNVTRKAKGKARIRAAVNGLSARADIKVKPLKKQRRR